MIHFLAHIHRVTPEGAYEDFPRLFAGRAKSCAWRSLCRTWQARRTAVAKWRACLNSPVLCTPCQSTGRHKTGSSNHRIRIICFSRDCLLESSHGGLSGCSGGLGLRVRLVVAAGLALQSSDFQKLNHCPLNPDSPPTVALLACQMKVVQNLHTPRTHHYKAS